MQQDSSARNTVIFFVLAALLLIVYQAFVLQPQQKARQAELAKAQATAAAAKAQQAPLAAQQKVYASRTAAKAASARIPIDTTVIKGGKPSATLKGSLSLTGARIDDLWLTQYRQTLAKNSPPVELFTPYGARYAYFARFSWLGGLGSEVLSPDAAWRPISGTVLAPGKPVTIGFDTVEGLSFRRTIAVDAESMFTITDTVTNNTGSPQTLAPFSAVQRHGVPEEVIKNAINVHQGAVGAIGIEPRLRTFKYQDWAKKSAKGDKALEHETKGGWLGITDKYWLAALIPNQAEKGKASFRVTTLGSTPVYEANYIGQPRVVAPGASTTETSRLFAGAKRNEVLVAYQKQLGLPKFDDAIDWGNLFWWLTRPLFQLIELFKGWVGNFGIAILMLTVVVRGVFFPLANQTFASGAKMKKLQPKIDELKKRFKDDPMKAQEAQMKLFQEEKINPLAGCLPILIQIPVFLALFKLLSVTIEMRHAEFFWFIKDLSARDPTTIWNLFGLIPWDPATAPWFLGPLLDGALHVGLVALLYAGMMALQQAMTPVSADPTQQMIMKFFPVIFMFILANYPVGLLIYWTWSTVLSLGQQYWFMRRYKVDNPIDSFLQRIGAEKKPATG
jgi:YidC/Oxa1 family membrane protein insertase